MLPADEPAPAPLHPGFPCDPWAQPSGLSSRPTPTPSPLCGATLRTRMKLRFEASGPCLPAIPAFPSDGRRGTVALRNQWRLGSPGSKLSLFSRSSTISHPPAPHMHLRLFSPGAHGERPGPVLPWEVVRISLILRAAPPPARWKVSEALLDDHELEHFGSRIAASIPARSCSAHRLDRPSIAPAIAPPPGPERPPSRCWTTLA